RPDGSHAFEGETLYDALGRPSVERTRKTTRGGGVGVKYTFNLSVPASDSFQVKQARPGAEISLDRGWDNDLSKSDFVYAFWSATNWQAQSLRFSDQTGKSVDVNTTTANRPGARQLVVWPVNHPEIRWFPDAIEPESAMSISFDEGLGP